MGRVRVIESSSIEQIVTGIILEVIDYRIDVIFSYNINKRIFLKKEIFNVAVKSQIVLPKFTTKHCFMM